MTPEDEVRANTLLQIIMNAGEILDAPEKYNRQPGTEEIEKIKGLMDSCYTELETLTTAVPPPDTVMGAQGRGRVNTPQGGAQRQP